MKVLGIETSCDETSVGVVENGNTLLSNVVASSMDIHAQYGGIVPEIAARSHIEAINPTIAQALKDADCTWDDIDAIAVTYGAGLGSCLLIGVLAARTLAILHKKPLYACNHLEGHVYANFITHTSLANYKMPNSQPSFPMLALIVSGKHTQLVVFKDHFDYTVLERTHDDALGEAFDKVARIIGLPYPGGPNIEKKAKDGSPNIYHFPKARLSEAYAFSFSGLKTAVLRTAQAEIGEDHTFPSKDIPQRLSEPQKANFAASFNRLAIETVVDKCVEAFKEFEPKSVVIAGGVAASSELRKQLTDRLPIDIQYPDIKLCTDNGAMIAALGCFKMKLNQSTADPYALDISPSLSM